MSGPTPASSPLQDDLSNVIDALTAATAALTEATRVLRDISARAGLVDAGAAVAPPPAMISTWEDDPFSEAAPTANPPVSALIDQAVTPPTTNDGLGWQITGQQPLAGQHQPGTPEFRYWTVQESLAGTVGQFVPLMPEGTRWTTRQVPLRVTLVAGQDLNARYARLFGLRFYQQDVGDTPIFSGESPDIVRHELGHALLDALRPELFDAGAGEVAAFHEGWSDVTAMLGALQRPSYRQRVLAETQGRLRTNSRLSRFAEQLGWGIRQLDPDAVDRDALRNAANRHSYVPFNSVPLRAPMTTLSRQPHSFARVFTGACLDGLAAMVDVAGGPDDQTLATASQDMAQLLVDAVLTASITPTYFSQVAAAMVQAAAVRNDGRYQAALRGAFVARGILGLVAARDLEDAAVPHLQPIPPGGPTGAAGVAPTSSGAGASLVLEYDDGGSAGYRADAASAPSLPQVTVHAEFLDRPVACHIAAEPERFRVSPSALGAAAPTADATDSAKEFLASLIQLGRIDPGPGASMARGPVVADDGRERYTHRLEEGGDGLLVLRRIQFQCLPRV